MSVEAIMDVQGPVGGTWDTWHSVKIMNELETVTMLNRVLSKHGTFTGYESVAMANAIFHFKEGRVRIDGGCVNWSHSEAKDQILFAFCSGD